MCNRQRKDSTAHEYAKGLLKSGCTFQLRHASLETERYIPPNSSTSRWAYRKRWDRPVKIVDKCMKHGEMCQQVDPTGSIHLKEVKNVSTTCRILQFTLCNYMEISGKLDYPLITSAMQQVWPRAKPLTKHDMFNVQVKIMQLLHVFRKSNGE